MRSAVQAIKLLRPEGLPSGRMHFRTIAPATSQFNVLPTPWFSRQRGWWWTIMLISWDWLTQYIQVDAAPAAVAERLMFSGLNLESVDTVGSDTRIDLEVTSNRPDCLSHLGVAREVAALFGGQVTEPVANPPETGPDVATLTSVTLETPDQCPRYIARVIRGVKVGPSPAWLVKRLETVGLRSVNNVVDITNYVLLECGQPLHAFDYDLLKEGRIVVRKGRAGESIKAIDQKSYAITPEMCVIADAERPVAIAGVMGGAETEITATTKNILIEVADFAPLAIRNTARKLGLFSDSSYRFERGIDRARMNAASRRACALILELAGGELCPGAVVVGPGMVPDRAEITLRHAQIQRVLGIVIPDGEVRRILLSLGVEELPASEPGTSRWKAPHWRKDLTREIDLIEEAARVYGYQHIPETATVPLALSAATPRDRTIDRVAGVLTAAGCYEAITVSFASADLNGLVRPWTAGEPLSVDHSTRRKENCLRQSLLPRLLEVRRHNERHGHFGAQLFEFARVYLGDDPANPAEQPEMLGVVTGRSFVELKGLLVEVAEAVRHGVAVTVQPREIPGLIPGRSVELLLDGEPWGVMGEITAEVRGALELRESAHVAEVRLLPLVSRLQTAPKYAPLPTQPAMDRDINLVLDEAVLWEKVEQTVRSAAGSLLETVRFDSQYRGPQIPTGKKSYVVGLTYRAADRTLTAEEVDASRDAVVLACQSALGATQR